MIGMGDKEAADQAAVDAMRVVLETVHMDGIVVIGEGEKDEAPMLYNGGAASATASAEVDVAVDPLEGTRLAAQGRPSALAVIALSPRGTMLNPSRTYMEKMAGGSDLAADLLWLDRPLGQTLGLVRERALRHLPRHHGRRPRPPAPRGRPCRPSATPARACASSPTAT